MVSSIQSNINNFRIDLDETLTDITTLSQSGPGSNDNERVLHIQVQEVEPHHRMQFSVISKTPLFF